MEYFGFNSPQFYSAYTKSELSMFYRPVSGVIPLIHPIESQCNSDCIFLFIECEHPNISILTASYNKNAKSGRISVRIFLTNKNRTESVRKESVYQIVPPLPGTKENRDYFAQKSRYRDF